MLILSRKTGERVQIGASVTVTVVEARHGQVRLAFDAPPDVAIDREEVRQRKCLASESVAEHSKETSDAIHLRRRARGRSADGNAGSGQHR
jgi:carbon storage regulator